MLLNVSKLYTPTAFEAFQSEYERSLNTRTTALDGNNEYLVELGCLDEDLIFEEEYKVIGDPLEQTATCSCKQFNRIGILCGHALKVIDLMSIKYLPAHYILKRWTKEARNGTVQDNQGRNIIENPKLDALLCYRFMSRKFHNMAHRAASFPECALLVDKALGILSEQVEEKMGQLDLNYADTHTAGTDAPINNDSLSNARLKKKRSRQKIQEDLKLGSIQSARLGRSEK